MFLQPYLYIIDEYYSAKDNAPCTVYTFCMCPGGYVVAAASEEEGVVTNGMSLADRDGENANTALLVTLNPKDFPSQDPLAGMYWQREIEQKAYRVGGGMGRLREVCGAVSGMFMVLGHLYGYNTPGDDAKKRALRSGAGAGKTV